MQRVSVQFTLNGRLTSLDVPAHWTLLRALSESLAQYDVKDGCSEGDCGACAVLLDGQAVNACMVLAGQAEGREVTTLRGLAGADGRWHPLQQAFIECGAAQCGYCTPGFLITAAELYARGGRPSREEIRVAISGNLCRCTGYHKIVDAIERALQGREG